MGIPAPVFEYNDNSYGLDLKSSPIKVFEGSASLSLNIEYDGDGAFSTRNGSVIINQSAGIPQPISGNPRGLALYDYKKENGNNYQIIVAGDTIYQSMTAPTVEVAGLTNNLIPSLSNTFTVNDDYVLFGNGTDDNLKFNGTDWTLLSIVAPTNATAVDNGAGTLAAGLHEYYVTYANVISGVVIQESPLSAAAGGVTIAASRQIRVTIPVSADTQVNARILYRKSPTSVGVFYRHTIITNNVATTYDDNTATDGTIEPDYDNAEAPNSKIISTNDFGQTFYLNSTLKNQLMYSRSYKFWNVPVTSYLIFDGEITAVFSTNKKTIVGTKRSIWLIQGPAGESEPIKLIDGVGILNNRCIDGISSIYFLGTNFKFYSFNITQFDFSQLRISEPLSFKVEPLFESINLSNTDDIALKYYSKSTTAKIMISVPIGSSSNNHFIIFNEGQTFVKETPVWHLWNNNYPAAMGIFNIGSEIGLYFMDYNGLIWQADASGSYGDGAEENGTVETANATSITDTTQTWDVNEHVGKILRIISGVGVDQEKTIISNTADTIVISTGATDFATTPDSSSEYTIGGYDVYHFTNWKKVSGTYNDLKRLVKFFANANADGDYAIKIIFQTDFLDTSTGQNEKDLVLSEGVILWGGFFWGGAEWGAGAVFSDQLKYFKMFKSIRIGFFHRKAGQPFQINSFGISCQNKGLIKKI